MNCPNCESENVREVSNLHTVWNCLDCGFEGDGELFDSKSPDHDPFCMPAINNGDYDVSEYESKWT